MVRQPHAIASFRAFLLTALALVALAGCGSQELYSSLPEQDANEMMAVLMKSGIACTKTAGEEETWKLSVAPSSFADAVETLKSLGYPKDPHADMGQVFQKSGLVSSPTEERIRFVYALSQELSKTLSEIEGVLSARVHIVLPNNDPFGEKIQPSSAAVFIKHREDADLESSIAKIKELVIGSIEGLDPDKVTVALFPAEEQMTSSTAAPAPPLQTVMSLQMPSASVGKFWVIVGSLAAVAVAGIAFGAYGLLRGRSRSAAAGAA